MALTFFAKKTLELDRPAGKYMFRLSSVVRGKQIADYLGAKFNPVEGFENDTCIHIKPRNLKFVKDGDYVDILDEPPAAVFLLKNRPNIKIIAMNNPHAEWLRSVIPNEVIIIPHAHVNFENIRRDRKEIINCGYIGTNKSYHIKINKEVGKRLVEAGFNFTPLFSFTTREDILNYYKTIDIQIIGYFDFIKDVPWYHEKKIVDAMSFGIPTIAGEKLGYRDINDFYIHANNLDELVSEAVKLRNGWDAERLIKKAEEYHISNVAKLYENLA
jgi:hypothetical protein